MLVVVVFSVAWFRVSNALTDSVHRQDNDAGNELPRWVSVSQQLERSWINGYLLKAVAEGEMPARGMMGDFSFFDMGGSENNPLLQIAAMVSPRPNLNPDECRKIYASQYDSRQVMEDRLWSGNDLLTTDVQTRVMLDPAHRLSYTDKVLTVAQRDIGNSGRTDTQEAIYTFFLPEGGVVTALSLWIEGKEEPGILTARSRAKEAYNTIVGRERRDPALVLWQEGNQVRVRVFPVTREMPRQRRKESIVVCRAKLAETFGNRSDAVGGSCRIIFLVDRMRSRFFFPKTFNGANSRRPRIFLRQFTQVLAKSFIVFSIFL